MKSNLLKIFVIAFIAGIILGLLYTRQVFQFSEQEVVLPQKNLKTSTTKRAGVTTTTLIKQPKAKPKVELQRVDQLLETFDEALLKQEELKSANLTKPVKIKKIPKVELGFLLGFFCGETNLLLESRLPFNYIFGPAKTSGRLGLGYLKGKDLFLQFDAVLNYPPGIFTAVDNYLGFGLNYPVRVFDGSAAKLGGQVFYGVESQGFTGKVFGEVGWGFFRTGSSTQKGLSVLLGYRKGLIF